MAIAFVQCVQNNQNGSGSSSVTLAATGAGNCLVAFVAGVGGGTPVVSHSGSGAYTTAITGYNFDSANRNIAAFYYLNVAAGITTVTATGYGTQTDLIVFEFSGVATSSASDATPTSNVASSSYTGSAITTATDGSVIVCGLYLSITRGISAGTGFTLGLTGGDFQSNTFSTEYKIQSPAGSVTPTFSGTNTGGTYDFLSLALMPQPSAVSSHLLGMTGCGQ